MQTLERIPADVVIYVDPAHKEDEAWYCEVKPLPNGQFAILNTGRLIEGESHGTTA